MKKSSKKPKPLRVWVGQEHDGSIYTWSAGMTRSETLRYLLDTFAGEPLYSTKTVRATLTLDPPKQTGRR